MHLHLFLGVAVVQEDVDLRHAIKGYLLCDDLGRDLLPSSERQALLCEFIHRFAAAARYGLIGCNIDALDARGIVKGLESHQHLHGRAIGIGDDVARGIASNGVRIHFGND